MKSRYFNRNSCEGEIFPQADFETGLSWLKLVLVVRNAAKDARLERTATAKKCSTSCLHKQWDVIMHNNVNCPL